MRASIQRLLSLCLAFGAACGASPEIQSSDPTDATSNASSLRGSLSASPQQVPVANGLGTTRICYSSNVDWSQVYVSANGAPEQLFMMEHHGGCGPANWIQVGQSYEFRLYAGPNHGPLLSRVTVTGYAYTPPDLCSHCATGSSCHCGEPWCWPSNQPCP